jgi:RHS repeat-associated protein
MNLSHGYDGAWGNLTGMLGASGYGACSGTVMSASANGNNQLTGFTYDAAGNTLDDGNIHNYIWDGESQLASANGVGYSYDGDGRRVAKVGSKFYWYGSGGEILAETDGSGNTLNEYVFFGGRRVSVLPSTGGPLYYGSDMLGTSRVMVQSDGTLCYDADFTPFGEERPYTSNCSQNYKFEGKERDTETGNDEFGARYYSWRYGRWLSSDWSSVPVPVPYANLTNPQTLNLYSMVSDDPESFADLDGHTDDTPVQSGTYSGSTPVVPTDNSNNSSETSQQGKLQAQQTTAAAVSLAPAATEGASTLSTGAITTVAGIGLAVFADVAAGAALIIRTADVLVENSQGKEKLAAVESQVAAENNAILHPPASTSQQGAVDTAPMQAKGQGGQGKGERGQAAKPDGTPNAAKHAKPAPGKPGRWIVKDPHTGKESLKSPGWQP